MQPLSGNQRPDLPTALRNMSLVFACHGKCIFADPLQMPHACHRFWKCYKTLTFCSLLTMCTIPCACHAKRRFNVQSGANMWCFNILTSKCASRHSCVHFFRHLNFQKCSEAGVFCTFGFEICFATQPRALFRHLNFQKWSRMVWFLQFDLEMCFAPQRGATFNLSSDHMALHPPL